MSRALRIRWWVSDLVTEAHIAWLVAVAELKARPAVDAVFDFMRRLRAMAREAERISTPIAILSWWRDLHAQKLDEECAKARDHFGLVTRAAAVRRKRRKMSSWKRPSTSAYQSCRCEPDRPPTSLAAEVRHQRCAAPNAARNRSHRPSSAIARTVGANTESAITRRREIQGEESNRQRRQSHRQVNVLRALNVVAGLVPVRRARSAAAADVVNRIQRVGRRATGGTNLRLQRQIRHHSEEIDR